MIGSAVGIFASVFSESLLDDNDTPQAVPEARALQEKFRSMSMPAVVALRVIPEGAISNSPEKSGTSVGLDWGPRSGRPVRSISLNRSYPSDEGRKMPDSTAEPMDRRPIATRNLVASRVVAAWLIRWGVSANVISIAGLVSGIAAGGVLSATSAFDSWEQRIAWLLGALFIQLRLAANMLDGMVAIESGTASSVGEIFNEIPDRITDVVTLIGAGYAVGGNPVAGYLAGCVALFVSYIRAFGKGAGLPNEFCGPMAKPQRMFTVTVAAIYSGLAPESWQPEWPHFGGLMALALVLIIAGGILTAFRRLVRITAALRRT